MSAICPASRCSDRCEPSHAVAANDDRAGADAPGGRSSRRWLAALGRNIALVRPRADDGAAQAGRRGPSSAANLCEFDYDYYVGLQRARLAEAAAPARRGAAQWG